MTQVEGVTLTPSIGDVAELGGAVVMIGSSAYRGLFGRKPMFEVRATLKTNAKRLGRVFICLLFCAFCCPSAQSQALSTDDIVLELATQAADEIAVEPGGCWIMADFDHEAHDGGLGGMPQPLS